ncbi:MAG TPA: FAD-binding oxidoreductase [Chitinophagaceae bacterium]
MDLHSGLPFGPLQHGIMTPYPSLQNDMSCEVAVIGGGITGATLAWHLSDAGHEVALFDRRHIAMGSTAATTALLQYELDVPLFELIKSKGEKIAVRSYQLCENAVHDIGSLCKQINAADLYQSSPSFQFASFKKHRKDLEQEFLCRFKMGIPVHWLDAKEIKTKFGLDKTCGILSDTGAGLDAFAFTHTLLRKGLKKNLQVYDHTGIEKIKYDKRSVLLHTKNGNKIKASKLIIACGYESGSFLPMKLPQSLYSTYAILSEPLGSAECWHKNALIWETAKPYCYLRVTKDNRIIIGGKDTAGSDPLKRYRLLPQKVKQLEKAFEKLFPQINFITDFAWAGTFASTTDGLPYIGEVSKCPHTFFVIGTGGNGILFGMIAAGLAKDWLKKKANKDMAIFSFNR